MKRQVIIIGGGASGLAAAIAAAREGAGVTVLEHMDRVGKKILSTGNGRCNLTNLSLRPEHYRCSQPQFPMKVLDHFSVWDTLAFFDEIGIVNKKQKRIYLSQFRSGRFCFGQPANGGRTFGCEGCDRVSYQQGSLCWKRPLPD